MGVGRGEHNYVLGMQKFLLKSAKQKHEAKFGTWERGNAKPYNAEKKIIQECRSGGVQRLACGNASI